MVYIKFFFLSLKLNQFNVTLHNNFIYDDALSMQRIDLFFIFPQNTRWISEIWIHHNLKLWTQHCLFYQSHKVRKLVHWQPMLFIWRTTFFGFALQATYLKFMTWQKMFHLLLLWNQEQYLQLSYLVYPELYGAKQMCYFCLYSKFLRSSLWTYHVPYTRKIFSK